MPELTTEEKKLLSTVIEQWTGEFLNESDIDYKKVRKCFDSIWTKLELFGTGQLPKDETN
jgi:hypothetical protein